MLHQQIGRADDVEHGLFFKMSEGFTFDLIRKLGHASHISRCNDYRQEVLSFLFQDRPLLPKREFQRLEVDRDLMRSG